MVGDLLKALDYAHAQKIVHWRREAGQPAAGGATGRIKLTDFGVARITDGGRGHAQGRDGGHAQAHVA